MIELWGTVEVLTFVKYLRIKVIDVNYIHRHCQDEQELNVKDLIQNDQFDLQLIVYGFLFGCGPEIHITAFLLRIDPWQFVVSRFLQFQM